MNTFSFNDIKGRDDSRRRYLRADWSAEENRFREGLPKFLSAIAMGNPWVEAHVPWNSLATLDVEKNGRIPEKNMQVQKECVPSLVESRTEKKSEAPERGDSGLQPTQPAQPKEYRLPASPSSPNSFLELPKPQKEGVFAPGGDDRAASMEDPFSAAETNKTAFELPSSPSTPNFMEGFNYEQFREAQQVANSILKGIADIDVDQIQARIPEYVVRLDLDAHRENPDVLADSMVEIQAKKDSLHAELLRLIPVVERLEHAITYLLDLGIICSTASSREKRIAQVKYLIRELMIKHATIESVYEALDKTYKHLLNQSDTVSRIITWHSMFPRDMGHEVRPRSAFSSEPRLPRSEAPRTEEAKPNTQFSEAEFAGLEKFPDHPKVPNLRDDMKPGEIDW